jgi:hypothetical protein
MKELVWRIGGMVTDGREPKYWEKNLGQCHLLTTERTRAFSCLSPSLEANGEKQFFTFGMSLFSNHAVITGVVK